MESCSCSELPPCTGVTVLPCPSQSFLGAETTRKSLEWQFGESSSTMRAALRGHFCTAFVSSHSDLH